MHPPVQLRLELHEFKTQIQAVQDKKGAAVKDGPTAADCLKLMDDAHTCRNLHPEGLQSRLRCTSACSLCVMFRVLVAVGVCGRGPVFQQKLLK